MAERIVIYSKQSGESLIPLTVRINWLSDGTIIPLMYWTPDGTCYQILSHSSAVPLAYLKDGGEGLRYKVLVKVIETSEPDSDLLNTRFETYIYLAHRRFGEKNIIDERYRHAGKAYIPVTMDVFSDGDYELVYFQVRGARYMVEKTYNVEYRGSFRAGGIGVWHKVDARLINADNDNDPDPHYSIHRPAALYLELNKWFVYVSSSA